MRNILGKLYRFIKHTKCTIITFSIFSSLKENIIRSQAVDKQQTMAQWFNNLMDGVERNLLMKNRDRYVLHIHRRSYEAFFHFTQIITLKMCFFFF